MGKRIARYALAAALSVAAFASAYAPPAAMAATPGRWVGYYAAGAPSSMAGIESAELAAGRTARVVNTFQGERYFPGAALDSIRANGSVPLVTMELWDYSKGTSQPSYSLKAIAAGEHDADIARWARNAKAWGGEVWLRPFHEMNGDWYPWCGTVNGNTPADFAPAWRHVVDVVRAEGASNVRFVWCPNADSVPNTPANGISKYWPGDAYVDSVAIDGYDFDGDRAFSSVFAAPYAAVTSLTAKPVFVAETGTGRTGTDKAAWISAMFSTVPSRMPRISGIVWFNADKERDWRFDATAATSAAFRAGTSEWARPHWVTSVTLPASVSARRGVTAYIRGTLKSDSGKVMSGRPVKLYRLSGGKWAYVATRTTTAAGSFSFTQRWRTSGTRRYKVLFPGQVTATDEWIASARYSSLIVK